MKRGSLFLLLAAIGCGNSGAGKTAYVGAEVFDGSGGPWIHDAVIIVSNGKIEAIGTPDAVSIPSGATRVPLDGRWVIPGLIDAHAHAERWTLTRYLAYGITSVRDLELSKPPVKGLRTSNTTPGEGSLFGSSGSAEL